MRKSALFSICSLGLGHAARTAPVIRSYLRTHDVHIVSYGAALKFLRDEFSDISGGESGAVIFYELSDYPPIERGKGSWKFYWYLLIDSFRFMWSVRMERRYIRDLAARLKPEFIIADGKYGSYVAEIPSFLISHQISFDIPPGLGVFQGIADEFNYRAFKKFDSIIIPDYEDPARNLAGKLSHHPMLEKLDHRYVGILALSPRRTDLSRDIEALFTVSGYLNEFRPTFVDKLLELAEQIPGKKVFVLGQPGKGSPRSITDHDIEIYPAASGKLRSELFNRAKLIISRSGYTTIMDLVELNLPAVLMPTPGQSEQEYLARYLGQQGYFVSASSDNISLDKILAASNTKPFQAPWKTAESVHLVQTLVTERVS